MDAAQKVIKNVALFLATALLVVAPGRAQSQLSATPNPVGLSGTSLNVNVAVGGAGPFTITSLVGSFFSVNPTSGTAPADLIVSVSNTSCSNGGVTCSGSFKLHPTSATGGGTDVSVQVTFTPGSGGGGGTVGAIAASPSSVTFNTFTGQSVSSNVSLTTSNVTPIPFSFSTIPANGTSWLSVSFSNSQVSASSSVNMNVFANATNITSTQSGSITIIPGNGAAQTVIPVTLNVGGTSGTTYSLSPTSISFITPGGVTAQQVVVFNNASITTFNVQITNCTGGVFFLVNGGTQLFNQAVGNGLTLTLNNAGAFATGTYSCQVVVSNPSNTSDQAILPVTLAVNGGGGGGTYTVSSTSVSFTSAVGSTNTQATTISVSSSTATTYNATFTSNSGGQWLYMNNSTLTTLANQAVANGLILSLSTPQSFVAGSYSGTITLSNPNGTGASTTINVSLTVGGGTTGGSYTVSNNTFGFQYPYGSQSGSVTVSSGTQSQFTASTTSNGNNGNWLSVGQSGGFVGTSITGTTSQLLSILLNTNNVPTVVGTYSGQVKIANPLNSNDFVLVNVSLQVNIGTGGGGATATPTSFSFSTSPGVAPASQFVAVTVPSGASFTSTINGTNFFASPCNGCTYTGSQNLAVTIAPGSLGAGSYTSYITLNSGGSQFATIQVNLTIGGSGGGTGSLVAPSSLTFAYQSGQSFGPPQQTITIAASGAFTASSTQSWLVVSPTSGSGPANLTVSVIPFGLAAGTNQGIVNITTPSGNQSVNVSLVVGSGLVLNASPGSINFNYAAGSTAYQTVVQVSASDNSSTLVTATPQQSWITLSSPTNSGNTPASYLVTANPAGLCNGINVGSITATASNAANSPLTIPVVALVSGSSATSCGTTTGPLTLSPASFTFSGAVNGAAPATQTLTVTAPSSSTIYTVSTNIVSGTTNWLTVSFPCNNCTLTGSQNLTIAVNQSNLSSGTYQGNILLTANGVTQTVPVTLTVGVSGATGNISVSPTSLSFSAQVNGSAPAGQNVTVTSGTAGVGYIYTVSTTSGGSWLSATSNGATLANGQGLNTASNPTITVIANPAGLAAGTYSGGITLSPNGGTAVTIAVSLTVQANVISASPSSLTFTYQAGGTPPSSQQVQVSGQQGLTFSTQVAAGNCASGWLAASPAAGTAAGNVTVSVNTNNLGAGTCNGSVTVAGTGTATGSTTISVTLTVTAPLPTITKVSSAASYLGQSISPGEVITIFGTGLGPTPFVTLALDPATGRVATTLGGVQVLVGGIAAPMVFASNTQVSAIVPYDIAFLQSTTVLVKFIGQTSNGIGVGVVPTAPGLFTANASGTGPGAILNSNLSANSPSNPANKGETVAIYMTGEGQTSPAGVNGKVTTVSPTPPLTPAPLLPVAVLIDGQPASISFAGEAPSLVSGVMQLNVQIPQSARSGDLSLIVSIGGNSSQNGVTVSVR